MAKMKLDTAAMKDFLFQKGEKVGLIACMAIMLLVVSYSLYSGFSSRGKTYDTSITQATESLTRAIAAAEPREEERPPPVDLAKMGSWPLYFTSFNSLPLFVLPDKAFTKRLNPNVMPIRGQDEKSFQFDYVRGNYFAYLIDVPGKKATVITGAGAAGGAGVMATTQPGKGMPGTGQAGGLSNLLKVVRPARMMVVSAVFPMRDQLEEFRKALRFYTEQELLARRDELPRPLGLEVSRCEILPGGKASEWTPLFKFEKDGKVTIASATVRNMLRHMLVDDENPQLLAKYIFPGLVTPLPKMANATYAKIDLQGIEMLDPAAVGADGANMVPGGIGKGAPGGLMLPGMQNRGMPGGMQPQAGGAGAAVEMQTRKEDWKKLVPELQDKFNEKYFAFDPLAMPQAPAFDPKKGPPGSNVMPGTARPGDGGMMQPGQAGVSIFGWDAVLAGAAGGAGMAAPGETRSPVAQPMLPGDGGEGGQVAMQGPKTNDALVRFFDPDVQPGKTYVYAIRVRMGNPNQGRPIEVAFKALAEQKELLPFREAPNAGYVYSPPVTIPGDYHWYAIDQAPDTKVKGGADITVPIATRPETAPIQVQRWMDRVVDEGNNFAWDVADWAIAERLYTRRGDTVGRYKVMIEMPRWNENTQAFEIGYAAQASKQPKKTAPAGQAIDSGLPVNTVHEPPFVIVDFEGGRKNAFQIEKRDGSKELVPNDSSAYEILVLTPDGKLVARNSRADADPETVAGDERQNRFESWRNRLRELRQNAAGVGVPGGPMPPGRGGT